MKKLVLLTAAFFVTSVALAGTEAEQIINSKLEAIKTASAECYNSVETKIHGIDLTALRFLSVIALNTSVTISADFSKIKTEAGHDCQVYEQKINAYVAGNDTQLEATIKGLESCASSASELKTAVDSLIASGKDLTDLYVELKTLDYSKPTTCLEAQQKIIAEKVKQAN